MAKNYYHVVKFLKLDGTSLICTITLSSILLLSGFSVIVNEASAQTQSIPIGDFYCWTIPNDQIIIMTQTSVELQDQFHTYTGINNFEALQFCDNADKDLVPFGQSPVFGSPLEFQHYTTYQINDGFDPVQNVDIGIGNFGIILENTNVGPVKEVWVPNTKTRTGGIEASDDFQRHYVCYELSNQDEINQLAQMETQFGKTQIEVLDPILLCNPAIKTHNGVFNPNALNLREHLTCFDFVIDNTGDLVPDPNPAVIDLTHVEDQLIDDYTDTSLEVGTVIDHKVCFESTKLELEIAGSFIPIDSAMLLLAGAQMIGAWIVPAIIASAGIAIVVARKY